MAILIHIRHQVDTGVNADIHMEDLKPPKALSLDI